MLFKRFTPPQLLAVSFLLLILLGTIILKTPWAARMENTDWLTALFTATSSVCVTGLVVVDTGTYWSPFGQLVILLLIQVGGLGVMSFVSFFAFLLGRRIPLQQKLAMQQAVNKPSLEGIVKLFRYLLVFSFAAEAAGALLLAWHWTPDMGVSRALWLGIFHSVSAFNNAGFDLFGNFQSLTGHTTDLAVNLIISGLFVVGGLGFIVIYDIFEYRKNRRLLLHTRVVLISTAGLVVLGTAVIFIMEFNHALHGLSIPGKIMASFFQAVTPRTAGFNTLDMNSLYFSTLLLIMLFMFIGGAPGSTAGGTKISTSAVLWIATYSVLRGKKETEFLQRRIPPRDVFHALAIVLLALTLIFLLTFLLSATQSGPLVKIMFESVSAMGTVGLSMGLTPHLNEAGQVMVIITMFLGRLGPLTIGYALAQKKRQPEVRYPEGKIVLG